MPHDRFSSIDVHAHFLPASSGPAGTPSEYFKAPVNSVWSANQAIAFMDEVGTDVQMLSYPVPPTSTDQVRVYNEDGASVVKAHPDRFGLLASLPMTDVEAALAELDYSFDVLHADGVALVTNYNDLYLGNSRFDPIYEALDQRQATVFIHPVSPACVHCIALGRPSPLIEFPIDTARTAVDMLFAGVFDRFPRINFILAHAGGTLPTLALRVAEIAEKPWCPNPLGLTEAAILKTLSGLYFDTAMASHSGALWPVMELAGAGQIVFGTDYPAAGEATIVKNVARLKSFPGLNEATLRQIGQTSAGLFSRCRT